MSLLRKRTARTAIIICMCINKTYNINTKNAEFSHDKAIDSIPLAFYYLHFSFHSIISCLIN